MTPKFFLAFTLLCLVGKNIYADISDDELLKKVWTFKMPTQVAPSGLQGTALGGGDETADRGFQFRVVNITSDGYLVIKFLVWPTDKTTTPAGPALANNAKTVTNTALNERFYMTNFAANVFTRSTNGFKYFRILRVNFGSCCEERLQKNQFSLGALTLPIKMRFNHKNDDGTHKSHSSFTGNVSAGLSIGWKRNWPKRVSLSVLGGFSLSSIPVSPETTNDFVKSETNQAAVTWHLGVFTAIDNFQIGVFTGIDYLSGQINQEWVYRRRPWLGIGIGFSFFNTTTTTATQNP